MDIVKKRNKGGMDLKNHQVKNHLWVFVSCLIVNPTFDSQTKEHMTLQVKNFGSKCTLSEKFITAVSSYYLNIVNEIIYIQIVIILYFRCLNVVL